MALERTNGTEQAEQPHGPLDSVYISAGFIVGQTAAEAAGRQVVYGLYDTDGILRFTCLDKEACVAYAELFELKTVECLLMALPEPTRIKIKGQKRENREVSNS